VGADIYVYEHSTFSSPKFRSSAFGGGWVGAHANLLDHFVFDFGHGSGLLKVNIKNAIDSDGSHHFTGHPSWTLIAASTSFVRRGRIEPILLLYQPHPLSSPLGSMLVHGNVSRLNSHFPTRDDGCGLMEVVFCQALSPVPQMKMLLPCGNKGGL